MLRFVLLTFLTFATASPSVAQDDVKLVKLVTVAANNGEITRQFFGHVTAKETVDLAFQVGGQVISIPIVEGDPVPAGALIAQLDLEPFEFVLEQARVQKEQADRTLQRLQQLQGNAVSQVTVDDAQTQAKLADIAVRNAERSLKNATLHAPFDALVAARNVANFSTISAGTPIARLHDMSEVRVEINVPETLFQRADRDPDIALWAKFPSSDEMFPLAPREYNAETSQVGQTFQITLGMERPDDLLVLPGSSVTVFATLPRDQSTLRVPGSAVATSVDGKPHVMVFTPETENDGAVSLVPVSIVPSASGAVEVLEGLTAGQEIVASGVSMLNDGDRVRRFSGFSK